MWLRYLGIGFNAFDNDPWVVKLVEFTKQAIAQGRVRIIGVCYGHQIVGRALGAKVAMSEGGAWEVSVCQVIQTEKGKELFGGKDALVRYAQDLLFLVVRAVEVTDWMAEYLSNAQGPRILLSPRRRGARLVWGV